MAAAAGPIVEHRIGETLKQDWYFPAVVGSDRQHRGVPPACTVALDRNSRWVDTQHRGAGMEPLERRVVILERSGKRCLGREPVVDGNDQAA